MSVAEDPTHRLDVVHGGDLVRLAATLDAPSPQSGQVPPLWHWTSFLERSPSATLGEDGHPRSGGLIADPPHPRRMFAGGRLTWDGPFPSDVEVTRLAEVGEIVHKDGRNGPLAFVTVTLRYLAGDDEVLVEEQDLVYLPERDPAAPAAPVPAASEAEDAVAPLWSETVTFDQVQLFRYSALTFNAHRIHYDVPYATGVEGYPGTVIHGPLLITRLMEPVRERFGPDGVTSLSFRAKSPAFCDTPVEFAGFEDEAGTDGGRRIRLVARRGGLTLMEAVVGLRPDLA
jgi:3-methylfumaryl-CoA hydratase